MIDYAAIMTQAATLRRDLGEDESSPVDVFALALSLEKLTMVFYPMGQNLSGMCIKSTSGPILIAINSAMTLGRQRFSMAHELYHLYFDESMRSLCGRNIGAGLEVEKIADAFASYFLMPAVTLNRFASSCCSRNKNGRLTLDDIIRLEQYFGVSHQAMVIRLMQAGFIEQREGNWFLNQSVRFRAVEIGFDPALYYPCPEARRYMTYGYNIRQIGEAYSRDLISNGKYEELLINALRADLAYGIDDGEGGLVD